MFRQLFSLLLKSLQTGSPENPSPRDDRIISIQERYKLLRDKFGDIDLYISHYQRSLFYRSDMEAFLKKDLTDRIPYIDDWMNCANFAYRLMGQFNIPPYCDLTAGLVWTNLHAVNCFLDENAKFWFVEPQEDKILEELEDWMGSTIRFIAM